MENSNPLKIVILGHTLFGSGKTTFCKTITDNNWHSITDRPDYPLNGYWDLEINEQVIVRFIDPPNARRFDFLWDVIGEDLFGLVVILDSSNPATFKYSLSQFLTFSAYAPDVPSIIAANKQDLEGAWDIEALRIVLRIPPEVSIIPCVATDKKSVANVLIALCEGVLRDLDDEAEA